jgi:hypothetical protein
VEKPSIHLVAPSLKPNTMIQTLLAVTTESLGNVYFQTKAAAASLIPALADDTVFAASSLGIAVVLPLLLLLLTREVLFLFFFFFFFLK